MKLTVISAAFNVISSAGEERLERSIRSVAAIPIEHEHLIIDGASTDGTVEVLRRFEAEIPSLKVVSEKDSGIYEALNKGLRAAKGEFFYVLGMDDVVVDYDGLAKMVNNASSGKYDMFIGQVILENGRDTILPYCRDFIFNEYKEPSYSHQGVIVRTKLARSKHIGMFDTTYRVAADYKQLLKLHLSGAKVGYFDSVLARCGYAGISSTACDLSIIERNRVFEQLYSLNKLELGTLLTSGKFPLRIAALFVIKGMFSFRMAIRIVKYYILRKEKKSIMSTYYLFNVPILTHRTKKYKGYEDDYGRIEIK